MNALDACLLKIIQDRKTLDVPNRWTLVGGRIAMPPKLTPEEWTEQYEHDEQGSDPV